MVKNKIYRSVNTFLREFSEQLCSKRVMLVLFIFSVSDVFAQPGNPGGDPDVVPIDGASAVLVAGAVAFGVKKLKSKRQA